ncbi:hypothetical protein GW17_00019943 [Ensete ventricosum]|nr:hypothetical protein GW17_00019943 [Ensete ventricosum]
MGEIEYPNSLIYPVKKLYVGSETVRINLMEDKSCQILIMMIGAIGSRLSASFPNRVSIESESDVKLFGSDN